MVSGIVQHLLGSCVVSVCILLVIFFVFKSRFGDIGIKSLGEFFAKLLTVFSSGDTVLKAVVGGGIVVSLGIAIVPIVTGVFSD